jgi:hypothetical protein
MMWRNTYECARCRLQFREIENIGAWQCTQHAIALNDFDYDIVAIKERGVWPCCGARIKVNRATDQGCVPCDHTPVYRLWTPHDDYAIPSAITRALFTTVERPGRIPYDDFLSDTDEAGGGLNQHSTSGGAAMQANASHVSFRHENEYFRRLDVDTFRSRVLYSSRNLPGMRSFVSLQ